MPVMIASTILCTLATYTLIRYGSISSALSRAGGQRILVDSPRKSFGEVDSGTAVSSTYVIRNESSRPITIQGARESCSCAMMSDLPCVIKPGASRPIELKVTTPDEAGPFAGTISLYTDDSDTPVIALGYDGRVVDSVIAKPGRGGPD